MDLVAGRPLLSELLPQVLWPTDLTTLDVDAMVIRETTHRFSRLSFHRSMVGRRMPLLFTASGRAYLSFCPGSEREQLIAMLASKDGEEGEKARDPGYIRRIVAATREQGYGANLGEWNPESRFAAIALPIMHNDRVYGCLNLVYMAKAMRPHEAASRYLEKMKATIAKIEKGLDRVESDG
ncbi:IclR family transcriptional regulator domain-containing protein [Marinobacterium aestuariivivens]|uniref:IclR family transcriptional regulator C-terminal domain-containing protein n=1 Tax=Marinobacterium aestuariivivens TaxID=1698799 RepID=A0ABW2A1X8_9GAMM